MSERTDELAAAGMRFDPPITPGAPQEVKIDSLTDWEFQTLLATTKGMTNPEVPLTLSYNTNNGLQTFFGEEP